MDRNTDYKLHELKDFHQVDQEEDDHEDQIQQNILESFTKSKNKEKPSIASSIRCLEYLLIFVLLAMVLYLYRQETNHLEAVRLQVKNHPNLAGIPVTINTDMTDVDGSLKAAPIVAPEITSIDEDQFKKWKQSEFKINPVLWVIQIKDANALQNLILANNKYFAEKSGFTVKMLNQQNFQAYLSPQGIKRVRHTVAVLKQRVSEEGSNLGSHLASIYKKLILLNVLYENGGVYIDDFLTLTQNLDWIRSINSNSYVNRGNLGSTPQIIGFFSPFYSSVSQKFTKKTYPAFQQVDKYSVLIPTVQNYFMAAQKKAEYLDQLIQEIINILSVPEGVSKDISEQKYQYIRVDDKDVFYEYFMIAHQRVLLKKQNQLDKSSKGRTLKKFAIDQYGVHLLNCYYGPFKLTTIYDGVPAEKRIWSLGRMDLDELETNIGPIRYMVSTSKFKQLGDFLSSLQSGQLNGQKGLLKGSFYQQMYFPEAKQSFIYQNNQKPFTVVNEQVWGSLPPNVWTYWNEGLEDIRKVPAEIYLSVQNIKKTAAFSQFTYTQVSASNVNKYLEPEVIQRIEGAIRNAKMKTHDQTKSQLYRLALLYKFGGVYLDPMTILTEPLHWIRNIAKYPSQQIFNRFGKNPEVLTIFNPRFSGEFSWTVDKTINSKVQSRLSLGNGFIAAIKQSKFIKQWLEMYLELLAQTYDKNLQTFDKYGVKNIKATTQNYHAGLAKDAAKCVIGRREKEQANAVELKNPMDFYKIWSISSFLGEFKLGSFTNYDNKDKKGFNHYLTRYPQTYVEGILGKIYFLVKIANEERKAFSQFLLYASESLLQQTHSESIFRKNLYSKKWSKFELVNDEAVVVAQ